MLPSLSPTINVCSFNLSYTIQLLIKFLGSVAIISNFHLPQLWFQQYSLFCVCVCKYFMGFSFLSLYSC
jgi:hypothetical protein